MTILTETRERFLAAITAQIPPERIAEIHFFQPIKQAGVESGVAVAAAWPEPIAPVAVVAESILGAATNDELFETPATEPDTEPATTREVRPIIYTARYRLTLKGIDRGKWESNVFAEADAPLVTVDAVVRGVQRRSGDVDDATRMDGDEIRAFVASRTAARP